MSASRPEYRTNESHDMGPFLRRRDVGAIVNTRGISYPEPGYPLAVDGHVPSRAFPSLAPTTTSVPAMARASDRDTLKGVRHALSRTQNCDSLNSRS